MESIQTLIENSMQRLVAAGVNDSAKIDVEILLSHTIGKNRSYLYTWPEKEISTSDKNQFEKLLKQRLIGKPIAYILGKQEFWGLNFTVNEYTLIPRADTEIIVLEAIKKAKNHQGGYQVLDLGTGSGAIICALKHELPKINAFAVDFDANVLKTASLNAKTHNLKIDFRQSDWFSAFKAEEKPLFQLIVSNPPYIKERNQHLENGDLRFEPITALKSGQDGLQDIKKICSEAPNYLCQNGWLLIEHGYQQAQAVQSLLQKNNFTQIKTIKDYADNDRVTLGQIITQPLI